jgi:hypothetical protein
LKVKKELTTPTLTLFGLGSAKKASVTPRIGSLGAGSTLRHHVDIHLVPKPELRLATRHDANPRNAIVSLSLSLSLSTARAETF